MGIGPQELGGILRLPAPFCEHLRFRLFGEWTSVPLPANEQPRIRAKLEELCPERESRFKD